MMRPRPAFLLAATLSLSLVTATATATEPGSAPAPARGPAYRLSWKIDLPLVLLSTGLTLSWTVGKSMSPVWCQPVCDDSNLNAIDKPFAGIWSPGWQTVSDVTLAALFAATAGTVFVAEDENLRNTISDGVVVAEAVLWGKGIQMISAYAADRPRPYLYSDKAPLEKRMDPDGALSLMSGHTTTAFASALAAFATVKRLHPHSRWPWVVLGVGAGTAGFIGLTRVLAGHHFPTDVLMGALVGTSTGLLLPALHDKPFRIVPAATPDGSASLTAVGWF